MFESTGSGVEIWTNVIVFESCEDRLTRYSAGEPITFDGYLVSDVHVMHGVADADGFAISDSVWFVIYEELDSDAFDILDVGLFDKDPLNVGGGFVDVEMD